MWLVWLLDTWQMCQHSKAVYANLANDTALWLCPTCTLSDLPFGDCSHLSTSTLNSSASSASCDIPDSENHTETEPLLQNNSIFEKLTSVKGIKFGHLNICSLFPKIDLLRSIITTKTLAFWLFLKHGLTTPILTLKYHYLALIWNALTDHTRVAVE